MGQAISKPTNPQNSNLSLKRSSPSSSEQNIAPRPSIFSTLRRPSAPKPMISYRYSMIASLPLHPEHENTSFSKTQRTSSKQALRCSPRSS
ncbi:hypothetical protein KUCAC02_021816 [Chaenocephalus aceratus]|uniref:Uncharacterized protein n=1 Tax=Chaenocephalus aceratus TaxID=36190 RepID=A0ACB9XIC0_CHAAC|nr:hypothetical protein KUCAC02_021816 [Chaenocephalus aceratus]